MLAIDRRRMVGALALLAGYPPALLGARSSDAGPRVDDARLRRTLEALSVFGRPAGGSFADGVSRVAYSDADIRGRDYVMGLMRDAGLRVRIDAAGNIIARREGREPARKPIIMGSHIDSVPSGGNFDGQLGSMAAIEVIRTLADAKLATRHPTEVRIWSNEEGGPVGSAIAAGVLTEGMLNRRYNGILGTDGLRRIGGDPDHLEAARIAAGSFRCYLELHIEQGAVLDKAGLPIGVVDGIVCIDEYDVDVEGFANHAGTTPMPGRRNALLAAAKLIEAVQQVVTESPGRQVGTVGRLEVSPNAPNVIPGRVRHTIELRDLSADKVTALGAEIEARAQRIAAETGTRITITHAARDPPALAAPEVQRHIEAAARSLKLPFMHLPSGAGHDAQAMAKLGPIGMIFVPSVGGISHSPRELSRWEDCANGANVLLRTLLSIDRDAG